MEDHTALEFILNSIELQPFEEHFKSLGISAGDFLNISPEQIPVILPSPDFTLKQRLTFTQKYVGFLKANGLQIPEGYQAHVPASSESIGNQAGTSSDTTSTTSTFNSSLITIEAALPSSTEKTSAFEEGESHSSDEDYIPPSKKSTSRHTLLDQPLVNKAVLGSKRQANLNATVEIDKLDMEELMNSNAFTKGLLKSYLEKPRALVDNDRTEITKQVVSWLLSITEFPLQSHYEVLSKKICALFPTEKQNVYYIPSFTEGENQTHAKGRLPIKMKNSKSWLRKKGALESRQQKRQNKLLEVQSDVLPAELTDEVRAVLEWLKRNREPFEDLMLNWKRCQAYRLQDLMNNKKLTPGEYIKKWHDILLHPQAFQLILDDFSSIHIHIDKYKHLQGATDALMLKWPSVSQKLLKLTREKDEIVDLSMLKEILPLLDDEEESLPENSMDFVVLKLLSAMCKPRARVKIGTKTIKPSTSESENAFVLHVCVAGEVQNEIRKRKEKLQRWKANIQPYIIAVGEDIPALSAFYVNIDNVLWKASSLLHALDICFKSFYVLDADYPPEAYHLWLFIQHAVYGFKLQGERSVANVTTLIDRLNMKEI